MDAQEQPDAENGAKRKETLRLIWLEALIALRDERKFDLAARQLGINRRTLVRYIDDLEDWLGFGLIERKSPGERSLIEFNPRGNEFCNKARMVVQLLYDSRQLPNFEQMLQMITAKSGAKHMNVVVRSVAGRTVYEID